MFSTLMAATALIPLVAKVKRSAYTTLNDPKLFIYASNVILRMEGVKEYEAFKAKVTILKKANQEYFRCLTMLVQGGNNNQVTMKNECKAAVVAALNSFEMQLNAAAAGVPTFITNAGFNCWKKAELTELAPPPQPYNVVIQADPTTQGCAIVKCACPAGYSISSVQPYLSLDGKKTFIALSTLSCTGGKINNLPRGVDIYLCLAAVGRKGLQSERTIPIELMVV